MYTFVDRMITAQVVLLFNATGHSASPHMAPVPHVPLINGALSVESLNKQTKPTILVQGNLPAAHGVFPWPPQL